MRIFISYAHEDTAKVMDVRRALDIHEVWFDHRLSIGQEWWNEIERQIAACHCLLFLMSPASAASEFCQKEIETALKLDKPIAPVMIEPMDIPEKVRKFQVISITDGLSTENTAKLLNGLFEIERQIFNPMKQARGHTSASEKSRLTISDLYFATSNLRKKQMYEQILNTELQIAALNLEDIQHVDAGEVALKKVQQAYEILRKPVFVDHSALSIRAWGGFPGGLTTTFIVPVGLNNICKMLQPFDDKHADSISVIAFQDGYLRRKFVGIVPGEIPPEPRGTGYSWNNIFIPSGFTKTLGEMTEDEMVSISSRRRAMIEFMRFLQGNYELV